MIVRVVVVSPDVCILVEASVSVDVTSHVNVGEDVLKFGVVVEGDGSEGVEVIGVNFLSLAHGVPFELLGSGSRVLVVRKDNTVDEETNDRVHHHVHAVTHATESRESVNFGHIFKLINNYSH